MRLPTVLLPAVLVVGFLFSQRAARAEYMDWSYHWSISPAPVLASGTGSVAQALGQPGKGSTRILAAAVTTSSDASTRHPDYFYKSFDLTLHLTDRATHQSGSLTFQGRISGTLTATSAHLIESFRTPIEHLKLGSHIYYVDLPSRFSLLPPGAPVVRDYYATVWVENDPPPRWHPEVKAASIMVVHAASVGGDPPGTASAPEPSSLVLVSLGVVLMGCAAIRRYRLDLSTV
jgi:hypothetical protein